jgi:hypothetical protein
MPLLNEADEIYLGDQRSDQVALGNTQIVVMATIFREAIFEPLGAFVSDSISTS